MCNTIMISPTAREKQGTTNHGLRWPENRCEKAPPADEQYTPPTQDGPAVDGGHTRNRHNLNMPPLIYVQ